MIPAQPVAPRDANATLEKSRRKVADRSTGRPPPPGRRSLERRRARRRRRLRAARRGLVLGAVPRTRNGSGRCSGVFDRPTAPTVSH